MPLEELLSSAKVVSLHLVPTAATHHLLGKEQLALMRPDSLLVNTSRSALVNTDALAKALAQGRPGCVRVCGARVFPEASGRPGPLYRRSVDKIL